MITEGILPDSIAQEAKDVLQTRLIGLNNIKRNLQLAQERMKNMLMSDMAYLKLQPYWHSTLGLHKELKLHSKYYDPFKILKKIG
jgi:hypothetical protein